jgi:hypothetical protein
MAVGVRRYEMSLVKVQTLGDHVIASMHICGAMHAMTCSLWDARFNLNLHENNCRCCWIWLDIQQYLIVPHADNL